MQQLDMYFDYVNEATRTLSPQWYPEKVSGKTLKFDLNQIISLLNFLDSHKKSLFYGRGKDFKKLSPGNYDLHLREMGANDTDTYMFHALIGMATEAGELLEQADKLAFDSDNYDPINVVEELGDIMWYIAIACKMAGVSIEDVQRKNIAKLKARFPEKFSEEKANNRDLDNERNILESDNNG